MEEAGEKEEAGLRNPNPLGLFCGERSMERKIFRFWFTDDCIRVIERSGKGERFVLLSLEQASWCLKSLQLLQSQVVGSILKSSSVSLRGRRNRQGVFVKLQVLDPMGFIFIPVGKNDDGLAGFVSLLHKAIDMAKSSNQPKGSYADVLMARQLSLDSEGRNAPPILGIDCTGSEKVTIPLLVNSREKTLLCDIFEVRIELIEKELSLLRSFVCSKGVGLKPNFSSEKMIPDAINPRVDIAQDHDFILCESAVQFNTNSGLFDEDFQVIYDRAEPDMLLSQGLSYEELSGCSSNCHYHDADFIKISVPSETTLCEAGKKKSNIKNIDDDSNLVASNPLEECLWATKNVSITSDVYVDIVANASEVEENHNSGRYQVLQNMKDSEEESSDEMEIYNTLLEKSYDLEDVDEALSLKKGANNIYWHDIDENFVHKASGVRYDPKDNSFFSWLSSSPDDMRVIYYVPIDDTLQLATNGWKGKANVESMQDQDWDRSIVYSEKASGFNPHLLELFATKVDELDSTSSISACE